MRVQIFFIIMQGKTDRIVFCEQEGGLIGELVDQADIFKFVKGDDQMLYLLVTGILRKYFACLMEEVDGILCRRRPDPITVFVRILKPVDIVYCLFNNIWICV